MAGRQRGERQVLTARQRHVLPDPGTHRIAFGEGTLCSVSQPVQAGQGRHAFLRPWVAEIGKVFQCPVRARFGRPAQPPGAGFEARCHPCHLLGVDVAVQAFGQRDELRALEGHSVLQRGGAHTSFGGSLQVRLVAGVPGRQQQVLLDPAAFTGGELASLLRLLVEVGIGLAATEQGSQHLMCVRIFRRSLLQALQEKPRSQELFAGEGACVLG